MMTATMRLIEAVERLDMTGEIGDGMVATLHDLAAAARIEQGTPLPAVDGALQRYNRAETRLRRARDAMDASTLGGRSRIAEAQLELTAAREAYEQQPIPRPEPLPVPSLGDLVTLSPDALAALKSRALRKGGPVGKIQVLERERPESFRPASPASQVIVADGGRCRNCGCPR